MHEKPTSEPMVAMSAPRAAYARVVRALVAVAACGIAILAAAVGPLNGGPPWP